MLATQSPIKSESAAGYVSVADLSGTWWVAQTRPRYEQRLARELLAAGIDHYLPVQEVLSVHNGRRHCAMLPAFPCYLFVCGDNESRYFAAKSHATSRMIDVVNQVRLIRELSGWQRVFATDPMAGVREMIRVGVNVEIVGGPFDGQSGKVERLGSHDVFLPLSILGRAVVTQVPLQFVRPVDVN